MAQLHITYPDDWDKVVWRIAADERVAKSTVINAILGKHLDPVAKELRKERTRGVADELAEELRKSGRAKLQ